MSDMDAARYFRALEESTKRGRPDRKRKRGLQAGFERKGESKALRQIIHGGKR